MSEGPRHRKAGIPAFCYLSGWVGGWWLDVLDEIKAILSPAGAWLRAELGKINQLITLKNPISLMSIVYPIKSYNPQ